MLPFDFGTQFVFFCVYVGVLSNANNCICEFASMVSMHLGNQVRKELNAVINVGSELPSDNPLRNQLITKKDDLESCLEGSLNYVNLQDGRLEIKSMDSGIHEISNQYDTSGHIQYHIHSYYKIQIHLYDLYVYV